MLSFYLIWSLVYFTTLWWMSRFWKEKPDETIIQPFYPAVTLIIPFRNEVVTIPSLSLNLTKLSYPNLKILLIDDHSEDESFWLLGKCFGDREKVQILKSTSQGKKAALEYGVNMATGEIILCTDADCDFPEFWIEKMMMPFLDPTVQLVAGAVMVEEKNEFLSAFQSHDWASILLLTNYFFEKKKPLMCSGASLAYRKSAFDEVNGYEGNREFASGDDEFLLKRIHKMYGKEACRYLASSGVLVKTRAELTWQSLLNQRIRWASKWRAHLSIAHALSAVGAFLAQLTWVGSFYLLSLSGKGVLAFGVIWLVKIAAEKVSLGKVLRSLDKKPNNFAILLTSFIHPFYVLRVGLGALSGKFTWKGREN